jgi:hypothetical protein
MKKQRKYKFKGIRGISKALTYYYKKRYSDPKTLKDKAKEINQLLIEEKLKPTIENILNLARKKQAAKKPQQKIAVPTQQPELPDSLKQVSYYFELIEYPRYILSCTNEIFFTSKLWDETLEDIQGGSLVEYNEYFSDYVNYINAMKSQTNPEEKKYETDWLVKCTEPVYNPITKRWESKIISVDDDGDLIDYGFDPKNPKEKSSSLILSQQKQQKQQTVTPLAQKTAEPTGKKSIDELKAETELEKAKTQTIEKEIEKEKEQKERLKQENIKTLLDLFKNKDITKSEFKEMMNDIKNG